MSGTYFGSYSRKLIQDQVKLRGLRTTPEHPFYTIAGEWVEAENLTIGDLIWSLDGDYGTVEDIDLIQTQQPMYNLTVAEAHTFFIGDGDWLVHNDDCGVRTFLHGSDEDSVEDIIENGLNVEKARNVGGGDVFWLLPEDELTTVEFFAQTSPGAQAGKPFAVLGIEFPNSTFESLKQNRIIQVDPNSGYYKVSSRYWSKINELVRFFRFK